jgi:NACalpha-BTF3-like transcription factor
MLPHGFRRGGHQPRAQIARGGNLVHSCPPGAWVRAHRSRQAALLLQHGLLAAPAEVEMTDEGAEDVEEGEDEDVELVAEYVYEEAEAAIDAQATEEVDVVVAEQLHASAGKGLCRLPTRDVLGWHVPEPKLLQTFIHTYIHTYILLLLPKGPPSLPWTPS